MCVTHGDLRTRFPNRDNKIDINGPGIPLLIRPPVSGFFFNLSSGPRDYRRSDLSNETLL